MGGAAARADLGCVWRNSNHFFRHQEERIASKVQDFHVMKRVSWMANNSPQLFLRIKAAVLSSTSARPLQGWSPQVTDVRASRSLALRLPSLDLRRSRLFTFAVLQDSSCRTCRSGARGFSRCAVNQERVISQSFPAPCRCATQALQAPLGQLRMER